jgi:hypothetical protein
MLQNIVLLRLSVLENKTLTSAWRVKAMEVESHIDPCFTLTSGWLTLTHDQSKQFHVMKK